MDKATVFTKTAKGITQVNQKSASLSKDLMKVLKLIDGKSNFGQLIEKAELDKNVLERALNTLTKDGFARVFETKKEELDPFAEGGDDDFDFTAPKKGAMPGATQRVIPAAANDISALAAQQAKVEADRKAKEAAHEQARLQAKAQAEARARADAEAKARQQAEQAAMEQAKRAKEASERAKAELEQKMREEEARKQALAAQQAKLVAEQKAKEEEEAKRMAELRARAEKEANERARAELEAKVREGEAKKKALAEQQAREALEQKAKEEEEGRKLAELRVRAEREAKALAEARARAEAEAAAMAKARVEAEAAAKKQQADAQAAEADMKAKLKEEIEARIRQEMEDLLRNEVEEKTRAQMQAEIMAEAKLAAKAELEERLREEREVIAKAEAEVAAKAESEAGARAEMESKKRAEAEARAKAETEARIRAEEETKQLRAQAEEQARKSKELEARMRADAEAAAAKARQDAEAAAAKARQDAEAKARETVVAAEARAKQEAEARARVQAEADARVRKESDERARVQAEAEAQVKAERQAKYEAEARAKIESEERDKRERAMAANLDAERKAKEEAEQRARAEAKARESVEVDTRAKVQAELENDMAKRAEIEGKAQAKAYMEAKVKAEADEDERLRQESSKRAKEIADVLRTKVEPDAVAPEGGGPPVKRKAYRRKGNLVRNVAFALIGGLILAVVGVHVVPMRGLAVKVEKAMSAWLNDDVTIAATTFRLIPSPHLNVQSLGVGKALEAKAATGRIYVDLGSLLGDKVSISSVELENVTITSEAVARILPVWGKVGGKAEAGGLTSIRLTSVTMDVKPALEPFNAVLSFNRDGTFKQANLNSGSAWSVAFRPSEKGMDVDFNARNWTIPIGAPITIGDVRLKGTLAGSEIVVPEFEASAMEGKVNGTLKVSWVQGVRLESDLSVERMSAGALIKSFTKDIAVTGRFDGNFNLATDGPSIEGLFTNPRVQGKFRLGEGSISNVDLVAVMQSDSAGSRAGVTKFNEVTGEFASVNKGASYRQVNLQGGVLRGSGQVDVGNNSSLNGRVNLEIRSQVAQDRGAFAVSGTVSRPIVRRGG